MLHTKFQGHRSIGSGVENFTIYGHGGHLGHVTLLICRNFHSYAPISFQINLVPTDLIVSEKQEGHDGPGSLT